MKLTVLPETFGHSNGNKGTHKRRATFEPNLT
jgi:hypothetical protein